MARITADEAGGANVLAFLDMLAWSEGTSNSPTTLDDGYDQLVGRTRFAGYADHPRKLVRLPKLNISSTAAGRYQVLQRYFDAYKQQLHLADFSPVNQDRIALQQIKEQHALDDIKAGRLAAAVEKCRNIWASLPGAGYNQHEQKLSDLLAQYRAAGGATGIA